jgi:DNA-binding SARP family transcriptional activator
MDERLRVSVLGPLSVIRGQTQLPAGPPQQRAMLAALVLRRGVPASNTELMDEIWGEAAPPSAVTVIRQYAHGLRRVLGSGTGLTIGSSHRGYVAESTADTLDLEVFERLVAEAHRARVTGDPATAADRLREALALWRGPALAGVPGPGAELRRPALSQQHLSALTTRTELDLELGRHREVQPELQDLVLAHPLNEHLRQLLMTALYRCGRQADAMATYHECRQQLADELGADPCPALQDLYLCLLRADPVLAGGLPLEVRGVTDHVAAAAARTDEEPAAPAQLPPDVPGFAGRAGHLAQLDAGLRDGGIFVVSGTAGVGKSALTVHWAHTAAHRFPDGQLYVNLRGFDAAGRAVDPADAVRDFLDALGVTHERIPSGLDAQAALYRSVLAGRRILVLLDNARNAEQVRPLLPATAGAATLVTSRNQLTGLLAAEGAHPVTLDLLPENEAHDLLRRRLGADRTDAEPDAVRHIVAACARLPLALAIAAARAQQNSFPLAALAAELVETGDRLDLLDTGDPAVQVRAVFSWSYAALSDEAARLFRLLGLHPGPDISTAAVAGLAGRPFTQARRLLGELTQATLITEHVPGRYVSHDLLRAYAADLTGTHDTKSARRAATVRLLDHYVHTAYAADRLLYSARDPIDVPLAPAAADSHPESLADYQQAMAWLATEYPVLLTAARLAADTGQDTHAWQLAWALDTFLFRRGYWHDRVAVWSNAASAAERLGDLIARAVAHRNVGRANVGLDRFAEARTELHQALDLCVRAGHQAGQANVHNTLAYLHGQQHDFRLALQHAGLALALYQALGSVRGQAAALSANSWYLALLGEYEQAIVYCHRTLVLFNRVGDRRGQAGVWDSLGYAHHHLGRNAEALGCYQQALDLVRDLRDRHAEAGILVHLGDMYDSAGDAGAARLAWTGALRILTELDHADVQDVHAKLRTLGPAETALLPVPELSPPGDPVAGAAVHSI